jgi:hypothetical protein
MTSLCERAATHGRTKHRVVDHAIAAMNLLAAEYGEATECVGATAPRR